MPRPLDSGSHSKDFYMNWLKGNEIASRLGQYKSWPLDETTSDQLEFRLRCDLARRVRNRISGVLGTHRCLKEAMHELA